jgi:hypothetical protein
MLLGGLRLVLTRPGAVVWTYVANLGIALLFSLRLHTQLAGLLDHSMAAERLNSGFDVGTAAAAFFRLGHGVPAAGATLYAGLPVYFLVYFLVVPGALFSYRVGAPGRLSILLTEGLCFFWRFVRITVLTVVVSGIVLVPLMTFQRKWSDHVDERVVGVASVYQELPGVFLILLVACVLRLYFDLVEVYTVQLDDQYRPNGKPDRRVRKTLIPAAKTLWRNLPRALGSFVLLALLGVAAMLFTGRIAMHTLAQPRVWPGFLLIQAGLFASLLARYWQRGAETIVAEDYPLPAAAALNEDVEELEPSCSSQVYSSQVYEKVRRFPVGPSPTVIGEPGDPLDAQPNPEPAAPSIPRAKKVDSGMYRVPGRDSDDQLG